MAVEKYCLYCGKKFFATGNQKYCNKGCKGQNECIRKYGVPYIPNRMKKYQEQQS